MAICICRRRRTACSSRFPATDVELRAELTRVVKELFGLRGIEADEYRVVVNSKALTEWIIELGFAGLVVDEARSQLGVFAARSISAWRSWAAGSTPTVTCSPSAADRSC